MTTNAAYVETPYYVLMEGKRRVAPEVEPLPSGTRCAVVYGFSNKACYDKFCSNSPVALVPYPLTNVYLQSQVDTPGDRIDLVVVDAAGPRELRLQAGTVEAVLQGQENRTPHVTAAYQLMLDPEATVYRVAANGNLKEGEEAMSTTSQVKPNASSPSPLPEQLIERLAAEVAAAKERIHVLQTEAAKAFVGQEKRFMRFLALADRIHAILRPRIDAFAEVNVFKDIKQNVSLELRGPEGRGFHGRTTTLTVPPSDVCLARVELSFRLGHDGPIENAIMDYRLGILPIFIKFESHDQLLIPIDNPSEVAVAAWIDDKLVQFTRTYFEMYFAEQYHQGSFEMDPVMNVRFPRAFAAGTKEYQGRTYHFFTEESLQAFGKAPSEYVETRVATAGVCLKATRTESDNDRRGGGRQ